MLKNIKQYINDLCYQISLSDRDDVIFIYAPLIIVVGGLLIAIIL